LFLFTRKFTWSLKIFLAPASVKNSAWRCTSYLQDRQVQHNSQLRPAAKDAVRMTCKHADRWASPQSALRCCPAQPSAACSTIILSPCRRLAPAQQRLQTVLACLATLIQLTVLGCFSLTSSVPLLPLHHHRWHLWGHPADP
jgi:hypothetical protein